MEKRATEEVTLSTFEALLAESGYKNYANKKVDISKGIPHDAVGNDHDSVGVLQQRVGLDGSNSWGWGNVYEAMDPNHAISVYIDRAMGSGRQGQGAHKVAQSVQRSAFSDGRNYLSKQDQAIKDINHLREECAEQARKGASNV